MIGISKYAYLVVCIAYLLLLFYGSYFIGSNFFLNVLCSAKTAKKQIAISFDDGPNPNNTPEILRILRMHNVKASFFCIGSQIAGNEHLLRQLHEEGHVIGNHSFSHHFWFDLFSFPKMLHDLQRMNQATQQAIGLTPRLFRPPYGVTNPNLRKAIEKGSFIPIGWTIRSMDTVIQDEEKLLRRVTDAVKPGAIILFHDTSKTTLSILPKFINQLMECGYEIIRLDHLLQVKAYA